MDAAGLCLHNSSASGTLWTMMISVSGSTPRWLQRFGRGNCPFGEEILIGVVRGPDCRGVVGAAGRKEDYVHSVGQSGGFPA